MQCSQHPSPPIRAPRSSRGPSKEKTTRRHGQAASPAGTCPIPIPNRHHQGHHQTNTSPRARRVKCDEGRPSCSRCITSKRVCDGYTPGTSSSSSSSTPSRLARGRPASTLAPAPVPAAAPSASPAWTPAERRAFDFYMTCSFPRLFSRTNGQFLGPRRPRPLPPRACRPPRRFCRRRSSRDALPWPFG